MGEWQVRAQCAVNLRELETQITIKHFPDIERNADSIQKTAIARFRDDPNGYFYPPDPTEMSASLGGTVATNASGARTYRYGSTRDWVRGIRVMLPSGEFLDIPRGKYFASPAGEFVIYDSTGNDVAVRLPSYRMPRTKNTSGIFTAPHMDLIDLFIGSEGCFGVITEVTAALLERRNTVSIVQFLSSDDQAIDLVETLRNDRRIRPDFIEFYSGNALELLRRRQTMDPRSVDMPPIPGQARAALFLELGFEPTDEHPDFRSFNETVARCGASLTDSWSGYEKRERKRLRNFRHILPETINSIIAERKKQYPGLHKLGTDLAVPDEHLRDMWRIYREELEAAHLQWAAFGHIGNNHLHINILPRNQKDLEKGLQVYQTFARRAVSFGGVVSAEHGIGKLKRTFLELMYTPDEIGQMRRVKQALDPGNLLNPGVIFCD
jgi:D-lactate dehydrogenase (cytochrome)